MNAPKNQSPTKRRNIKSWMMSRQRRLYWKNKESPQLYIAQRIDQLAKQVMANVAVSQPEDSAKKTDIPRKKCAT